MSAIILGQNKFGWTHRTSFAFMSLNRFLRDCHYTQAHIGKHGHILTNKKIITKINTSKNAQIHTNYHSLAGSLMVIIITSLPTWSIKKLIPVTMLRKCFLWLCDWMLSILNLTVISYATRGWKPLKYLDNWQFTNIKSMVIYRW